MAATRYAVYARYSSDHQSERSIDDQLRLCHEYLSRTDKKPAKTYTDYAISGAHLLSRPGIVSLMEDAEAGVFDVVLAEDLSRLSRDQEDIAAIFKRLKFRGIELETVSEGRVNELHIGFKGTMNAMFLRDLADKIRRGQRGRIRDGLSAGGLAYGYRVVRKFDAKGELVRGLREIDPDQASVIHRIYSEYAAGCSARAIAKGLNADGIPSPTGKTWGTSTINGNAARRSGILYNEAYAGFLVYNRVSMVKNPETGRRVSRPNPPEEWLVEEAPHLKIVEQELWDQVQARKDRYSKLQGSEKARRPKRVLSGLIECGCCGGSYTMARKNRYGCSTYRQKGTCDNNTTIKASEIEGRVITALKDDMLASEAVEEFIAAYHSHLKEIRKNRNKHKSGLEKEIVKTEKAIRNIVEAIKAGMFQASMKEEMDSLEKRQQELKAELEAIGSEKIVDIHPGAGAIYRARIEEMERTLKEDPQGKALATNIVRDVIDKVVVSKRNQDGSIPVEVHGALAPILMDQKADKLPLGRVSLSGVTAMVAEEGLEPPTQGL